MKPPKYIAVEPVPKEYYACNACLSKEGVLNIKLGNPDTTATYSIRLCKSCQQQLIDDLLKISIDTQPSS
jgi:hypothetical protein